MKWKAEGNEISIFFFLIMKKEIKSKDKLIDTVPNLLQYPNKNSKAWHGLRCLLKMLNPVSTKSDFRNEPLGHISSKEVEITHFASRSTQEIQVHMQGFFYWPNFMVGKDDI